MINQVLTDPLFYFCAVPAVIIFGIAKGGFGGTLSIIAVPLISIAVPPAQAAAIMLPILCVMDLMAVRAYWREWHTANLRILLPASVTGILLGTVTFSYLSEAHIRILIGTIALSFVAYHWLKQHNKDALPVNAWKGRLWGCIAGFTSFGIHAGGPPLSVYLLPQRLPPRQYMSTSSIFFIFTNYIKVLAYLWLGQLNATNLATSLILLPLAPVGIWLGYWLFNKISQAVFYRFIFYFLFATGIKLIYEGIQQWP